MGCLLDALSRAYDVLGFDAAAGGDEVFRGLVLARIIEPASKLDSLRVLGEAGVAAPSYRTLMRRLPVYAKDAWRQKLSAACAAHARLGAASLVLYDVSTLYFEIDEGDGFRIAMRDLDAESRMRDHAVNKPNDWSGDSHSLSAAVSQFFLVFRGRAPGSP